MAFPLSHRRLRVALLMLSASIWIAASLWIARAIDSAEQQARRELATIARILAEHTDRTMQSVDRLMLMLTPRLAEARSDPAALQRLLRETIQGLPHVRAALVLDAGGMAIGDSESAVPRPFHGADREYFRVHQRSDNQGLFIGPPVRSRINGLWAISLSRRIADPAGDFLGVVVVAVDPQYFVDTFAVAAGLDVDSVSLIGRDGILRARYPADPTWLGRNPYADPPGDGDPFATVTGWLRHRSPIDGIDRHVAYGATLSFPLIVTVGRATTAMVIEIRHEIIEAVSVAALLTLLVVGVHRHLAGRLRAASAQAVALEEARARAVESERVKSHFLAGMSHELRTPLNAILGFSELLRSEPIAATAERRRAYAGHIHDAGTHLLATVNDILDQASIEAGRLRLDLAETDPTDAIRSALRMVEQAAEKAGVRISSRALAEARPVIADIRRLRQIIVNLAANAVKFTPAGGMVEIQYDRSPDGRAVIRVVDTGIGMTEQEIATALEPFGRIDNAQTRAREGTGLGLPIAKALAELQGASLAVLSRPGAGTTVSVVFPAAAAR